MNFLRFLVPNATILIVACVAANGVAGVAIQDEVPEEDKYATLYAKASADLLKMRSGPITSGSSTIEPPTLENRQQLAERIAELKKLKQSYRDKLLSLSTDDDDYRFRLAELFESRGDHQHAQEILNDLAPENEAGYPAAHLIFAKQLYSRPAKGDERSANLGIALKHVDHYLSGKEHDLDVKLLKARITAELERNEDAYQLYEELLEENPRFYREMIAITRKMNWEEREQSIYETAFAKYMKLADEEKNTSDVGQWIATETGISKTLQGLYRFEEAEERLKTLIDKFTKAGNEASKRVFLQSLLADVYVAQANEIVAPSTSVASVPFEKQSQVLDLYIKAHQSYDENQIVLQALTRLTLSQNPEIAKRARSVYDPIADTDAPAGVLNQLGNLKLRSEQYPEAIRYLEMARSKLPQNASILNNLAYAYLKGDEGERYPKRALALVNESMENLPKDLGPAEVSKFLHTKATALRQLERFEDALNVYEQVLYERPKHEDSLRMVIECYRSLKKTPPEQYVKRLKKLK